MKFQGYGMKKGLLDRCAGGDFIWYADIQMGINKVFDQYEADLAAAIKTGLLEDKEISAIQATVKNLKERLKVETAD